MIETAAGLPFIGGAPPDRGIAAGGPRDAASMTEAAQAFEGYLLKLLLEQMQKTVGSGGLFEGESAGGGYQALAFEALARRASEARSFGLAQQLLRHWEAQG